MVANRNVDAAKGIPQRAMRRINPDASVDAAGRAARAAKRRRLKNRIFHVNDAPSEMRENAMRAISNPEGSDEMIIIGQNQMDRVFGKIARLASTRINGVPAPLEAKVDVGFAGHEQLQIHLEICNLLEHGVDFGPSFRLGFEAFEENGERHETYQLRMWDMMIAKMNVSWTLAPS